MKINQIQENLTPASTPSVKTIPPKFGRSDEMLESDAGTTGASAVATVSAPMGKMQRRGKGSMFQGISTSEKFANSRKAGIKESYYNHDDNRTGFAKPTRQDDEGNSEFDDKMRKLTGMIFYSVNDTDLAQQLGLKQTRTGKWFLRTGNRNAQQAADRAFGQGKVWYPQNESMEEGQQWPDSSNSLAKRSAVVTDLKGAPSKAGRGSGMTVATRVDPTITSTKVQRKDDRPIPSFLQKEDVESSPVTDLKTWQVVIFNNYYAGKYSDYRGRYYYVLARNADEAKQVVLDNADGILQDILSMKSHNGKRILPPSKAVPITSGRIGKIEDGTVAGRMSTAGYKKMFGPQGLMMVKLSGGAVQDIQEPAVDEGMFDTIKQIPKKADAWLNSPIKGMKGQHATHAVNGAMAGMAHGHEVGHAMADVGVAEVAPPGAKAERMVKHIKKGYAKDGKLTPREKSIAYATAWKAHNAGKVEEAYERPLRPEMNNAVRFFKAFLSGTGALKRGDVLMLQRIFTQYAPPAEPEIAAILKTFLPLLLSNTSINPVTLSIVAKKITPQQIQQLLSFTDSVLTRPIATMNQQQQGAPGPQGAPGDKGPVGNKGAAGFRPSPGGVSDATPRTPAPAAAPIAPRLREQEVDEASFDYTTKDLGNDYAGFPSQHSLKHKFLAKIKPEKQQLYKDKMNNTRDWDSLFALFKVAKERGDIIEQGIAEGVAETMSMDEAKKVLRHYGADNFKTTSNELYFYKNGQQFSVDLTLGADSVRSVSLSQLNQASRQLKGQGVTEGDNPEYDDESGSAESNLHTIARAAQGLIDTIGENENLPEWCQEKIAKVEGMLVAVWDYLESQESQGIDPQVDEDWQKTNKQDKTDGMSGKAVKAYRRENPGSKLKTAVTTKPSKLKAGSKDANRRKSFCARMSGNKGPMKDEKGRPTPKAKALSRWNCESVEQTVQMLESVQHDLAEMKQRLDPKCWKGYKKQGTKMKGDTRVNNCVKVDEAEVSEDKLANDLYKDFQIFKKGDDKDIGGKAKDKEISSKAKDKEIQKKK